MLKRNFFDIKLKSRIKKTMSRVPCEVSISFGLIEGTLSPKIRLVAGLNDQNIFIT